MNNYAYMDPGPGWVAEPDIASACQAVDGLSAYERLKMSNSDDEFSHMVQHELRTHNIDTKNLSFGWVNHLRQYAKNNHAFEDSEPDTPCIGDKITVTADEHRARHDRRFAKQIEREREEAQKAAIYYSNLA